MDKKWEFDAPQFIDFTQPDQYEPFYDDSWFDRHTEADDFKLIGRQLASNDHGLGQPQRIAKVKGAVRPMKDDKPDRNSNKNSKTPNENNENSSEKMGPSPKKRQKLLKDSPMEAVKSLDTPSSNTRLKTAQSQQSAAPCSSSQADLIKIEEQAARCVGTLSLSPKKAGKSPKAEKPCPLTRSQSLRVKNLAKACSTSNLRTLADKHCSPGRMNSVNDLTKIKTSEQLELEKIAEMKKETAKMRKLAQESYKKAINADGYIPVRSKQQATLPVAFNFKTDERLKNVDGPTNEPKVKDFTKSLREALPISVLPAKPTFSGITKPQPFHLHTQKTTAVPPPTEKYESVAERVAAFYNRTPERFRTKPNNSKERSRSVDKSKPTAGDKRLRSQSPKLTIPKTPNLTTRGRSRPVHLLTAEEKELKEFEEHKKQQFKAHPVNQKVFEAPNLGVPKVAPKAVTVAEGFNFHYKKSVSSGDLRDMSTATQEEEKFEFHARPVNPKILQGRVGVKPVEPQPLTVPQSPAFALRNRVRLPVEIPKQEECQTAVKAHPVPFNGVPFRPKLSHNITVPEPFAVEERSKEMLTKKEHKIQQILEEERKAREFHARSLPSDSPDTLPPKQPRPITQPEPFHLHIDERGEKYQQQLKSKLEEEQKAAIEATHFKARPNVVATKEPFLPEKSSKPLTEISDFELNTEQRAVQREVFDQRIKAHEAYLESVKRQKEEEKEREEKAAVARMRQEAVHRASAIKKYKTVVVKPSDRPLTEAKSPKFSTRLRGRLETSDV